MFCSGHARDSLYVPVGTLPSCNLKLPKCIGAEFPSRQAGREGEIRCTMIGKDAVLP